MKAAAASAYPVVPVFHPRREARRAVKRGYPRGSGTVRLCRSVQAVKQRLEQRLVAAALSVTRERLSREFGAGGAPNLKRVIDPARAACAADLLGNPGYTVRGVLRILGYASPSHLAGAARRGAGATPVELRELGPRGVLTRFLRGRTRSRV